MSEPRHYVCERCGGTGQQPDGCWNQATQKYDAPAGVCDTCGGGGQLGVIGTAANARVDCDEKTRTSLGTIAKQDAISSTELARLRKNSERWEMVLRNPFMLLDQAKGMRFSMTTPEKAISAVDAAISAEKAGAGK